MESIIRVTDWTEGGLIFRLIHGLNILDSNPSAPKSIPDPRIQSLRLLTNAVPCSLQVGDLALEGLEPANVFGPCAPNADHIRAGISLHGGTFYEPSADHFSHFFPLIRESFWDGSSQDVTPLYVVKQGALVLYADPKPGVASQFESLLSAPFTGERNWLEAASAHFALIVYAGHDGQYFTAVSRAASHLEPLALAVDDSIRAIRSSKWYTRVKKRLEWDDLNLCLIER